MRIIPNSPVEHDGAQLKVGKPINLPDEQAQALVDAGVATEVLKDVADKKEAATQGDGESKA